MAKWGLPFLMALSIMPLFGEGKGDTENEPPISREISMAVTFLEGDVRINDRIAETGQTVPFGSTVATGHDGFCEILFAEKNIIRIEADTETELNVASGKGNVNLKSGQMALLLEKLDALLLDKQGFTLTTQLTTAGIRGTAFFVKVESDDSVYLCCCNGAIEMNDKEGGTPYTLQSGRHQAVRYTYESGLYSASAAPLLYHDDAGMDHLADQIGYTIPWDSSYGSY